MDEDSIKKTAFITPIGLFEWLVEPFGVKNGAGAFTEIMRLTFAGLDFVVNYIDDITIFSKDNINEHMEHIKKTLQRIEKVNLKLNEEKSEFFKQEIRLLGYVISHNKITMDPKKIEPILKRPPPRNQKEVQEFIGLFLYYKDFVQDWAAILAPLYQKIGKWC